jgi:hypothetical protein
MKKDLVSPLTGFFDWQNFFLDIGGQSDIMNLSKVKEGQTFS